MKQMYNLTFAEAVKAAHNGAKITRYYYDQSCDGWKLYIKDHFFYLGELRYYFKDNDILAKDWRVVE